MRDGLLEVGDGHRVYCEVCGNADGKPAVVLRGGPGSGCTESVRRFFDPNATTRRAGSRDCHAGPL